VLPVAVGSDTDAHVRARGGTYLLHDPVSGEAVRVGRTNDLERRRAEHRRDPLFQRFDFEVDRRTDDEDQRRGREQILIEQFRPRLNRIRGIDPRNPRRLYYLRRGHELD
jgi:hypothetical protein